MANAALPDVFSPRELARATGLPLVRVRGLIASGGIRTIDGRYVAAGEARRVAIVLASGRPDSALALAGGLERPILSQRPEGGRMTGGPLALSTGLHVAVAAGVALLTTVGATSSELDQVIDNKPEPLRLVYLMQPGPSGGGGGGGTRMPRPPSAAARKGPERVMRSPIPARSLPAITPVERPPDPPPLKTEPLPTVVAPVATVASDQVDRAGVPEDAAPAVESRGPATGGGAGTGAGTGLGDGHGPGIGPGSGGGTGGGPYRPGSGIDPPRLIREVKPVYSEEARQRSVEGDVVLEIVVRRDGSVGDVRVIDGLGYGLDRRALEAVKQWRFSPARRLGAAVDVIVEVAVEFRLR